MKKSKKILVCTLVAGLSLAALGFAACSSEDDSAEVLNGTYTGEYSYENYGTQYGVKVSVVVEDGVISSVTIVDSDYVEATDVSYWANNGVYYEGKDALLAAYSGKTVNDILALSVAVEDGGAPLVQKADGFTSYGDDILITNATQSSGRLLLAVQNALKNA